MRLTSIARLRLVPGPLLADFSFDFQDLEPRPVAAASEAAR